MITANAEKEDLIKITLIQNNIDQMKSLKKGIILHDYQLVISSVTSCPQKFLSQNRSYLAC